MKPQAEINAAWNQTYTAKDGSGPSITMLQQPAQGIPGLRKPYQFVLDTKTAWKLPMDLRKLFAENPAWLQCDLVERKGTARGFKLNVFLLGYRPGFCGDVNEGLTAEQWKTLTNRTSAIIAAALGENIAPYCEDWNAERKFQYRFETYIHYTELL